MSVPNRVAKELKFSGKFKLVILVIFNIVNQRKKLKVT